MLQEKVLDFISNEEFLKKVISQESVSEVQKLFKDQGVDITEKEVSELGDIIDEIANKISKLKEEELENISGGAKSKEIGGAVGGTIAGLTGATIGISGGIAIGDFLGGLYCLKRSVNPEKAEMIGRIIGGTVGGLVLGTAGLLSGYKVGYTVGKSVCGWRNNDKNRVDV